MLLTINAMTITTFNVYKELSGGDTTMSSLQCDHFSLNQDNVPLHLYIIILLVCHLQAEISVSTLVGFAKTKPYASLFNTEYSILGWRTTAVFEIQKRVCVSDDVIKWT